MDKQLLLFNSDGSEFVVDGEKIVINDFKYSAKRMGTAPTITATINHPKCLDDLIDNTTYTVFNDEKYFLKGAIASSYDSSSIIYKHETTWGSERAVLETVYFFDTVKDSEAEYDAPLSNSSTFSFFGDIHQFATRFNASLSWSGLGGNNGYKVVVDESVNSDSVELQFNKVYLYKALQEANTKFEIPFYFKGKEIHFGDADSVEFSAPLEYGAENSLTSIKKVVKTSNTYNRITGVGSERNISYFYPNPTPKGTLAVNSNVSKTAFTITNMLKFSRTMPLAPSESKPDDSSLYAQYKTKKEIFPEYYSLDDDIDAGIWKPTIWPMVIQGDTRIKLKTTVVQRVTGPIRLEIDTACKNYINISYSINSNGVLTSYSGKESYTLPYNAVSNVKYLSLSNVKAGTYSFEVEILVSPEDKTAIPIIETKIGQTPYNYWSIEGDPKEYDLEDFGLSSNLGIFNGAIFWQYSTKRVNVQNRLMPSKYRKTDGAEWFYEKPEGGVDPIQRRELIIEEDIYPSITNTRNAGQQLIDSFVEFAYDDNDNDEIYPVGHEKEGQYVHPYFYAKLKRLNGRKGFNLFDHAIENNPMTISFTDGKCGGCNFTIGVGETGKNEVQVEVVPSTNGNGIGETKLELKRDSNDNVIATGAPIPQQNNTIDNEVWIALKKEDQTFGTLMPHASPEFRPSTEDKFVILNIDLPEAYVTAAEEKLTEAIKAKLDDSAEYKFGYSVKLSRVFFEGNMDYAEKISENVRIPVRYNNKEENYYVTSYNYTMKSDSPLPEVSLELDNSIETKKSAIALLQEENNSANNALLTDFALANDRLQGSLSALTSRTDEVATLAAEASKSSANNTSLIYNSIIPNWQILYTTANSGKLEFGDDVVYIESHTFEDGIGVITISPNINAEIPAGMFDKQRNLSKVRLPSNIKKIGDFAFRDCIGLLEVNFGSGLETISTQAFYKCEKLFAANIPSSVVSIGGFAFAECTKLTNLQLGKELKEIGASAFYNCKNIQSLTIPENVNEIGYDAWGYEGLNSNMLMVTCGPIIPPKISTTPTGRPAKIFGERESSKFSIYAPSNYKNAQGWNEYKDFINSNIASLTIPHVLAYQTALNASDGGSTNVNIALKEDDYPNTEGFLGVAEAYNLDGTKTLYIGANVCREHSDGDSLATVKSVEDVLEGYADRDSLREGTAEHVFTWRVATGNSRDADSLAVVNKLLGRTVKWNQLINGCDSVTDRANQVTVSYDTYSNEIVINNTSPKKPNYVQTTTFGAVSSKALIKGHKYLICADRAHLGVGITEGTDSNSFHNVNSVFEASFDNVVPRFAISSLYDFAVEHSYEDVKAGTETITEIRQRKVKMKLNLFDLTEMFGSENEPESLGEFRMLYPKAYYDDCITPKTVGVKIKALPSASYNLWNKDEAIQGAIMYGTGWLRSDNWYKNWWTYIMPVSPNTRYYLKDVANRSECMPCVYFNEKMEWVGSDGPQSLNADDKSTSGEIVTPDNAAYMAVMTRSAYKDDACCVSVSSRRNGDYEEYIASGASLSAITELKDAKGNKVFPYGLLEGGGVFDEVGEGYAIQRVDYELDSKGEIVKTKRLYKKDEYGNLIYDSNGKPIPTFNYYSLDNRLWMTWRLRRGGTERIQLDDVSAPFRATISYALDANDLLAKPIKVRNDGAITLLAIDDEGTTFDTDMLIGTKVVDIEWGMDKTIPTCNIVRDYVINYVSDNKPTTIATAPKREFGSIASGSVTLDLDANIVYEFSNTAIARNISIKLSGVSEYYAQTWTLRLLVLTTVIQLNFQDISVQWKDGTAPSTNSSSTVGGVLEIVIRQFGDSYIGEWKVYK